MSDPGLEFHGKQGMFPKPFGEMGADHQKFSTNCGVEHYQCEQMNEHNKNVIAIYKQFDSTSLSSLQIFQGNNIAS